MTYNRSLGKYKSVLNELDLDKFVKCKLLSSAKNKFICIDYIQYIDLEGHSIEWTLFCPVLFPTFRGQTGEEEAAEGEELRTGQNKPAAL